MFAFSLGEMFAPLSLNLESWGVDEGMIGLTTAMAPVGILIAGTSAFSTMCGIAMDLFGPHGLPVTLVVVFVGYLIILGIITWRRHARAARTSITRP